MQRKKIQILTLWQDEVDCNENESVRPGDVLIEIDFRPDNDRAGNAGLITVTRVKREHALGRYHHNELAEHCLHEIHTSSPVWISLRATLVSKLLVVLYELHENIH